MRQHILRQFFSEGDGEAAPNTPDADDWYTLDLNTAMAEDDDTARSSRTQLALWETALAAAEKQRQLAEDQIEIDEARQEYHRIPYLTDSVASDEQYHREDLQSRTDEAAHLAKILEIRIARHDRRYPGDRYRSPRIRIVLPPAPQGSVSMATQAHRGQGPLQARPPNAPSGGSRNAAQEERVRSPQPSEEEDQPPQQWDEIDLISDDEQPAAKRQHQ